jgi:S-adenosylmethionine:tRNA-ribosyltransferase-isomerase (queuine synthetase)
MAQRRSTALERLLTSNRDVFSRELAEHLLALHFSDEDQSRYRRLSKKAQQGTLTEKEMTDLDDLLTTNDLLTVLKSKARRSLRRHTSAA